MTLNSRKLHVVLKSAVVVALLCSIVIFYLKILPPTLPENVHNKGTRTRHGSLSYFKTKKTDLTPKRLILPRLSGRLGNAMFSYASMIGISKKNYLNPVFPANHYLRKAFKVSASNYSAEGLSTWKKISENHSGYFEEKTQHLQDLQVDVVELAGYFQSWKYFEEFKPTIFEEFTFLPHLNAFATEQISKYIRRKHGKDTERSDVIVIGVHLRVGDLTQSVNIDKGYVYAPPEYIQRSIRHFESRFQPQKLLFIICTDSHSWVLRNFPKTESQHVLVGYHSEAEDLAILSSCDHVIMTVGTFGWWAGYLSRGQVIYYANYAKMNSSIFKEINPREFFYEGWIPML